MINKDFVLNMIENDIKNQDDEWVQKWVNNEVSILEEVIKPNEVMIRPFKDLAISIINTITVQDLQGCCIQAKPHLQNTWVSDKAINKMNTELTNIKNHISKL